VRSESSQVKIALIHKRLDLKGGTERDLFLTAQGLCGLGHEVHLLCSEFAIAPPSDVAAHPVRTVPLGRTAEMWSAALATRSELQAGGYDAVVSFGRFLAADVVRCGGGTHRGFLQRMGRAGGKARRLWQNFSIYHRSVLAIEQRQFESPRLKKIIAVSNAVKRDVLANYPVAEDKIAVLYNGVDARRFHPGRSCEERRRVRERWKIPANAPLVLFVGSGFRRKGLDRLLPLWRSPKLADCYLLVVGADARMAQYRARAEALAPGRVVFADRQEDVENYYAAADLVALVSLQEAFGNVVLEALAAGLPVLVSCEVGAAEILVGDLSDGVVEDPDDRSELERKLLRLLEHPSDAALACQARQIAEAYSWDEHFRKFERILLDISGAPADCRVA
jgi:UDP-glucose:(heptosyl)LPS alpha-1,3-glucosyltransferase